MSYNLFFKNIFVGYILNEAMKARYKLILWILIGLVAAVGIYLRLADLDADPPFYFDGSSQSLSTDPYQYTFHARNKVLFDEGDPLGDEKWNIFKPTIISGLSYTLFSLLGVSRVNANLAGSILSLLSIFLFLLALRKFVNLPGLLLVSVLLIFNRVLFIYGRVPYNENGMLFIISLLFFIFVYYRNRLWGLMAIGILVSLAGLAGKIFGFLLFVPLAVTIWFEGASNRRRDVLIILGSSFLTAALWFFIFYGGNFKIITDYLFQQSIGLYGFPDSLKSPVAFFSKLVSFGNDSLFYDLSPVIGLGGLISLIIIISTRSRENLKENPLIFFMILWFFSGLLFFMLGNYRPLRYSTMLYYPLAGLAGYITASGLQHSRAQLDRNIIRFALYLFFILWLFFEPAIFSSHENTGAIEIYEKNVSQAIWISILAAAAVTFAELRFGALRTLLARRHVTNLIFIALMILSFLDFGAGFLDWHRHKSFNIKEAGKDLSEILASNAIISGPMAPTLLSESRLRGLIYAVGISKNDARLFDKFPVTHFVVDAAAAGLIVREFPQLANAHKVTDYWIRDVDMILVRISDLTGNRDVAAYKLTDYEIAYSYMEKKNYDSAFYYLQRFVAKYPDNKSALKLLGDLYAYRGDIEAGLAAMQKAVSLYPRDFSVILKLAIFYHKAYIATDDRKYQYLAGETYLQVAKLNPHQVDDINKITGEIDDYRLKKDRPGI